MLRERWELRSARRKGRRDGRAGVPSPGQEALPFELRGILARVDQRLQVLLQRFRRSDAELEGRLAELEQRAADAVAHLVDLEARRDAAAEDDRRLAATEAGHLGRLQRRLEELPTDDVPQALREPLPEPSVAPLPAGLAPIGGGAPAVLGPRPAEPAPPAGPPQAPAGPQAEPATVPTEPRPPEPASTTGEAGFAFGPPEADASWRGFGRLVYWPLVVLIVLGELPLNAFAFRLFHEADWMTYVLTVTVAVGLVTMAHFAGLFLGRPTRTAAERGFLAFCVAAPLAGIAVIAVVREGYLRELGGDTGIGPLLGTLAFGLINVLVFGAAAALSYAYHDPRTLRNRREIHRRAHAERARLERLRAREERERLRRARELQDEERRRAEELRRRELAEEQRRHEQQLELLRKRRELDLQTRAREAQLARERIFEAMRPIREAARERSARLAELDGAVEEARSALGALQQGSRAVSAERRGLRTATLAAVRELVAARDRLIVAYCSANVRARRDHEMPACFERIPRSEVPRELLEPSEEAV